MNNHEIRIGSDVEKFDTAEEAATRGYELAKLNPGVRVNRYINDRLVSSYSPKYGWS